MYKDSYAVSVLLNGHVAREEGSVVKVQFGSEYGVRIKNKLASPVVVDLFVDGQLTNKAGHICLVGNSSLDIDQWVMEDRTAKKFQFEKLTHKGVAEPNESENGLVEVRFYKPKEQVQMIPTTIFVDRYVWPYYPVYPMYPRPYWPEWYGPTWCVYNQGSRGNTLGSNLVSNVTTGSYTGGNVSAGLNIGASVNANDTGTGSYGTADINGATVQGRPTEVKDTGKVSFELMTEPVTLQLRLVGEKASVKAVTYCADCGYRRRAKENFCPKCGYKFPGN